MEMVNENSPNRRRFLGIVSTTAAASISASGLASASSDDGPIVETLRGTSRSPVTTDDIRTLRREHVTSKLTASKDPTSGAVLDLEPTLGDSRILGYNLIDDGDGVPREQFVTRDGRASAPDVGVHGYDDRLHAEADDMLETAKTDDNQSTVSPTEADFEDWYTYGSTDLYHEFPKMGYRGVRPGNVKFVNEIARAPNQPRAASRAKVRMEPGRQVCNDGFDGYCSPTIQDGYKNAKAIVHQDWDKPVNDVPTDKLIKGTSPEGQLDDVSGTRSASISLSADKSGPSASVGYSSSVSFPGAALIDSTTLATGRADTKFEIESPSSYSSTNNAIFEVGSAAKWQPDCGDNGRPVRRAMMDIDVDLKWGLDVFWDDWGTTQSATKSFNYATYC
jgi:hypothetical protein